VIRWIIRIVGRVAVTIVLLPVLVLPWGHVQLAAPGPHLLDLQPAEIPHGDARFLVVGLTQDRQRTDTIEVVQWDDTHHLVRILGVPRDASIALPNIGNTKLVHAYSTGGVGRARLAVARLLNIRIDHYVVFSLPAMRHIVDLVGGVPLTVEKRMVYTDHKQGLFIDLYPGPQVLDGAHAEQFLRFRNDSDADIGRIRRQQQFIRAFVEQTRQPWIYFRLPQIMLAARADVETDLTSSQLLGWMQRVGQLSPSEVSAETIGGQADVLYDDLARQRLDFWILDPDDIRAKARWLVTGTLPVVKP